jgi:serpin B
MMIRSIFRRPGGFVRAVSFVAAWASAGCGGSDSAPEPATHAKREARALTSATADLKPAIDSVNRFGWALYRAAARPSASTFFSPFSLDTALGMTYAAARGETADEMRDALAIEGEDTAFHAALGALLADIGGEHARGYTLRAANGFFGSEDVAFAPDFTSLMSDTYAAAMESVPFRRDPEAARTRVNDFVAGATQGRIEELVPSGRVDVLTLAILVNAVHFEAPFATAFDPELTSDAPFLLEDGTEIAHPLMTQKGELLSAEDADFALVELDYADAEIAFDVLVPHQRGALAELEPALTLERVESLLASAERQTLVLGLPRFELALDLDAKALLGSLGMRRAFVDGEADLSGLLASESDLRPYVTDVLHRAYVRVDERGTEAAAGSAVVVGTRGVTPSVVADHPFVFMIRDKLTGVVLFLGRVADPRG